jgi:uncharacterized protein (TIGR00106 family)
MLMELNILPLGHGESFGADLADILTIIDESGLDYRLTATGTNVEGGWDELMDVARRCHKEMRKKARRVVTTIKIDDYGERTDRLAAMVRSVESKAGKPLRK